MKKKIRIPIIPIILVIIAIIIVVVVINKNSKTSEEQLLQGEYDKLSSMQSYQFTKEKDSKNKTIVAKDGDKTDKKLNIFFPYTIQTGKFLYYINQHFITFYVLITSYDITTTFFAC